MAENGFKYINLWQTSEQRKQKYWLARASGANAAWATKMRDWRPAKIKRFFGLKEGK